MIFSGMVIHSRRRRVFTPQQRQAHMERFRRSGLTQAEYCRRAKLSAMTFSLWRRLAKPAASAFAEIKVSESAPVVSAGAAVLHLPGGARLEVAVGSDAAWRGLGSLLKSLQS